MKAVQNVLTKRVDILKQIVGKNCHSVLGIATSEQGNRMLSFMKRKVRLD
jgi:hypothetical protein